MEENKNKPNDPLFDQFLRIAETRGFEIVCESWDATIHIFSGRTRISVETPTREHPRYYVTLDLINWIERKFIHRRLNHTDVIRLKGIGTFAESPYAREDLSIVVSRFQHPQQMEQDRQAFIQLATQEIGKRMDQATGILASNQSLYVMGRGNNVLFRSCVTNNGFCSGVFFNLYMPSTEQGCRQATRKEADEMVARILEDKARSTLTREWIQKLELLQREPERTITLA